MEIKGLASDADVTVDILLIWYSNTTWFTAEAAEINYTDVSTLGTSQAQWFR